MLDRALFADKLESGWVVTEVPVGGPLRLGDLGDRGGRVDRLARTRSDGCCFPRSTRKTTSRRSLDP